jgi:hypothetical protein
VCIALISTNKGAFIGVKGRVTDLIKSVTCQVVAGGPSHMASRQWSSASTDLQLRIPLYCLLESVTVKPTPERLQGGPGRPPPRLTGQRPLHTASSCQVHPGVTLNLVEFQISLQFLEMLQFGTHVPEFK